ncbi:MAG: cytochrome c oxidase subunit I, partial [Nostoc sp.]
MTHDLSGAIANDREPENGWRQYFSFSTDHKVIGVQYMVMTFIFFLLGGLLAMIIRAELLTPESNLVDR